MQTLIERVNELKNEVGRPYQKFNEDGTYQGCFYVVQKAYPNKPRYKMRSENDDKNYFYGIAKLRKHCIEIEKKDLQIGDIVVTRFKDELHVALYLEYGKVIHVCRELTLRISKMDLLFKGDKYYFRVNE